MVCRGQGKVKDIQGWQIVCIVCRSSIVGCGFQDRIKQPLQDRGILLREAVEIVLCRDLVQRGYKETNLLNDVGLLTRDGADGSDVRLLLSE
jgi:hypothetical protein